MADRIFVPGPTQPSRAFKGNGLNVGNPNKVVFPGGLNLSINPYQVTVIDLSTIFVAKDIQLLGTTFWVEYATLNTALCFLSFESTNNPQIAIYPTFKMDGFPFTRFYLNNANAQVDGGGNPVLMFLFTCIDLNHFLDVES